MRCPGTEAAPGPTHHLFSSLLQRTVPSVLDCIVSSPRQQASNDSPAIAVFSLGFENHVVFLVTEGTSLEVTSQLIDPSVLQSGHTHGKKSYSKANAPKRASRSRMVQVTCMDPPQATALGVPVWWEVLCNVVPFACTVLLNQPPQLFILLCTWQQRATVIITCCMRYH
jgi:hypothetical protein